MEYLRRQQIHLIVIVHRLVSILLLQWNTYEAFYYFFFFLIEFVFQSFFYNGIPTKLLEISIPSTLSRVSILLLQWNTYEALIIPWVVRVICLFQSFFYNGIPTKTSKQEHGAKQFRSFNPSFTMEYLRRPITNNHPYPLSSFNPSFTMEYLRSCSMHNGW